MLCCAVAVLKGCCRRLGKLQSRCRSPLRGGEGPPRGGAGGVVAAVSDHPTHGLGGPRAEPGQVGGHEHCGREGGVGSDQGRRGWCLGGLRDRSE